MPLVVIIFKTSQQDLIEVITESTLVDIDTSSNCQEALDLVNLDRLSCLSQYSVIVFKLYHQEVSLHL